LTKSFLLHNFLNEEFKNFLDELNELQLGSFLSIHSALALGFSVVLIDIYLFVLSNFIFHYS